MTKSFMNNLALIISILFIAVIMAMIIARLSQFRIDFVNTFMVTLGFGLFCAYLIGRNRVYNPWSGGPPGLSAHEAAARGLEKESKR